MNTIDSHTTHILSEVQRIVNTATGYSVRTTTHTDTMGTIQSTTAVYSVYDPAARIQQDPYTRTGTVIDTLI